MRRYIGNPPEGDDWITLDSVQDDEGARWGVYIKRQDHTPDWITVKVASVGPVLNKANYWLAKNVRTGQVGFGRDMAIMRANRPGLHAEVEAVLDKFIGCCNA